MPKVRGAAPEGQRFYWVSVQFPEESDHPGRFIWKLAGDTPESIQSRLRKRYPDPTMKIQVVREVEDGERQMPR